MQGKFLCKEDDKNISITYERCKPIQVKINKKYQVNFVVKPEGHLPTPQLWEVYVKEKRCIKLESLIDGSLDEYIQSSGVIQNFLNFIIPSEVLIESIEGIAHKNDPYIHSHGIKQHKPKFIWKYIRILCPIP
jgi:hypothetical protein